MASPARKISAKTLIADIRAGLDNPVLMRKYSLSEQQHKAVFEKLIERGALGNSELNSRSGEPLAGQALTDEAFLAKKPASRSPVSVTQETAKLSPQPTAIMPHNEGPTLPIARLMCPACRTPHHEKYAVCPQCGVTLGEHEKTPSSGIVNVEELTGAGKDAGGRKLVRKAAGCVIVVDSYVKRMLRILRNTDQPTLSYVWRAWLIAFIPSLVIGAIATSAIAMLGYEDSLPDMPLMFFLIWGVLIAPWVETVFMVWILAILKLIVRKPLWVCLVSAVIWGALHGLQSIGQGVTVTWVFFILSLCFLEWEKKSRSKAIRVAALIHMCQNGLAFIVMIIFVLVGVESTQVKKIPPSPPPQTKEVAPGRETQKFHGKGPISLPAPVQPMDHKQAPETNKQ